MDILSKLKNDYLFFDGGMGTLLQQRGLKMGVSPEMWNITHSDEITEIHRSYFEAGANVVTTNTFGANPLKMDNVEEVVRCAIANAKNAKFAPEQYIALDIGPTGRLLKPLGDLDFEDAVEAFATTVRASKGQGCDLIIIETMNDPYELKAAILACKENSDLPIFATFVLDEKGKTMTGCDIDAMVAMLEGLGVSALGVNCSLGADKLKKFVPRIIERASVPVVVNPNAGMPCVHEGRTCFDSTPEEFLKNMLEIAEMGARVLGGCCGTTPEYIRLVTSALKGKAPKAIEKKGITVVSSYSKACTFENKVILIGERINPTGKPKLKTALRENNINYLIGEAIGQEEHGADMLDVNVGLPEIDEVQMLTDATTEIQSVTSLPLQLDTSNPMALEKAMRIYNGKPLVNSVNGKEQSITEILPLVAKYGGAVIALTLDENGIPSTAQGRYEIARKIVERALEYGIDKKDIIVDPLCLTVSSDSNAPRVTLDAIKLIKEKLGVRVSLGISNVSFGLPNRDYVTSTFFALALQNGLDAVIMNPYSNEMMKIYYSYNALAGIDIACEKYIAFASSADSVATATPSDKALTLKDAIIKGLRVEARELTKVLILDTPPLEIVNNHIIPALDIVGANYEKGISFLPQLLMSAETANVAFEVVREKIPADTGVGKGGFIIATVKGDIHDIGKNIVKVILQNYGYRVHDLGKDVSAEAILDAVKRTGIKLVGLSALMTTTVPSMEATIKLLKEYDPEIRVIVGGAVLTVEYAEMIKAGKYARDAMETVRYTQEYYGA
ncbi:MAG: homocysteine S-methyltransferase family protein [Clostridia bacterium]|nr:homocysteine S-methyltransferase family protein [Clostridia bacterium]